MICSKDFGESVVIESVTETTDGAGGYAQTWSTRVTIFAMVEDTGGGETTIAGRLEHTESLILTTHYDPQILPIDRAVLDGCTYKITRIENIDRSSKYMRIYLETGRT